MVTRFIISQGIAVMLLLYTSLSYDSSLAALKVDMTGSLQAFQWVMITIPPCILLLLLCAAGAVCLGFEIDVNCDGDGDGLLGPCLCLGFGTVAGLFAFGIVTLLDSVTSGLLEGDASFFRGLLLTLPPSLPPLVDGVGFLTPLIVAMLTLNFVQLLTLILSFAGPRLALIMSSTSSTSATRGVQIASIGRKY